MSIWTSLLTGSSGLTAYEQAIGIVGDNISNVSTTGYRASRAGFSDVLGGYASNGQRAGNGVAMTGPETLLGQGSLQQTGRALDLAVRGNGLFVLQGQHNGADGQYYTRDGRFGLDKDGYVANGEGLRLQGYSIDPLGVMSNTLGDLRFPEQDPPRASAAIAMNLNLDPSATSYATSTTVYDSLGNTHRVDLTFTRTAAGWDWTATVDGAEVGGTAGTPSTIGTGTLTFDTNGNLTASTGAITASFTGATPNQAIAMDFTGTTTYAGPSDQRNIDADGYAAGALIDVQVADDGTITGRYSNGESRPVGRVALATFAAEGELTRAGSQLYRLSNDSGEARIGGAATGTRGGLSGGALEASNVDLGAELVTLIAYQRAFQANARTVTTADEVLTELTNIKR